MGEPFLLQNCAFQVCDIHTLPPWPCPFDGSDTNTKWLREEFLYQNLLAYVF